MMIPIRKLEQFAAHYTEDEDEILKELDRETNLNVLNPRMLSGHLQGKMLEMFSRMINPAMILEIGTYTGYSAICLAKGLQAGGRLHTIDVNDELSPIASKYFLKSGLSEVIIQHTGDALDVIPSLNDTFDFVFIDGDKREYCAYFDVVFEKVRPGGFLIADNVLWNGKVIEETSHKDMQTKAIMRFIEKIKNDTRVSQVIIPFRDGLMLIGKDL